MDLWSKEDDSVMKQVNDLLNDHPDYRTDMKSNQLNGLRRKIKSKLYEALPAEEKERWEKAAEEHQPAEISEYVWQTSFTLTLLTFFFREDMWLGLPSMFATFVDGIYERTKFHCFVLAGGKTPSNKVVFYG
jgi:hypothetical protein